MRLSTVVATVATVPLTLGLAACGNDARSEAPVTRLDRVTFVPAMSAAITQQKSWRVTGEVTANGKTLLTLDGVQTAEPPDFSMELSGAEFEGKTAKVVMIGSTAYVSIPGTTPDGKYLKVEAGESGEFGELLASGDPTKIYKSFGGAVRSVTFVGTEAVRRQKLDRYELVVDTAKVLAAQGKTVPAGAPNALTYSIWMDKAHLIRKLEVNLFGTSMVMSISDYNKPVTISAPPASKIVSR